MSQIFQTHGASTHGILSRSAQTQNPLDDQALIALAKQRACTLRREAVPEFWHNVETTGQQATRSLTRYLHRLARHRLLRLAHPTAKEG